MLYESIRRDLPAAPARPQPHRALRSPRSLCALALLVAAGLGCETTADADPQPGSDAAAPQADGAPQTDAVIGEQDSSCSPAAAPCFEDGSPPPADAAPPRPDGEPGDPDAAPPRPDAAPADAAPPPPDAAVGPCEPGESTPCGGDVGACRPGLQVCGPDAQWGECQNDVGPVDESCNGEDDDCDGATDEGLGGAACQTGAPGPCAEGLTACEDGALRCVETFARGPEICDDIDNDCNGEVDDVPIFEVEPAVISVVDTVFRQPALSWDGERFAIAWNDGAADLERDIYFQLRGPGGNSPALNVNPDSLRASSPALAWNGNTYLVAWEEQREGGRRVMARALTADGEPVARAQVVDRLSEQPGKLELHWGDDAYSLVWSDRTGNVFDLRYARLRADGALSRGPVQVTDDYLQESHASVWNGEHLGLLWVDPLSLDNVRFQHLALDGMAAAEPVVIDRGGPVFPHHLDLAWNGAGYGMAYSEPDDNGNEVYFLALDADGRAAGDVVRVTNAPGAVWRPRIFWVGEEYRIIWLDRRDGRWRLYHTRLSPQGERLGADLPLTQGYLDDVAGELAVHWTGERFGVAWTERDDGAPLRFAYGPLGCP